MANLAISIWRSDPDLNNYNLNVNLVRYQSSNKNLKIAQALYDTEKNLSVMLKCHSNNKIKCKQVMQINIPFICRKLRSQNEEGCCELTLRNFNFGKGYIKFVPFILFPPFISLFTLFLGLD